MLCLHLNYKQIRKSIGHAEILKEKIQLSSLAYIIPVLSWCQLYGHTNQFFLF